MPEMSYMLGCPSAIVFSFAQFWILSRAVLKEPDIFFFAGDRPKGPPTANSHQPPTAANHQPPPTANCHQPWLSTWSARGLFLGKLVPEHFFPPPLRTALILSVEKWEVGVLSIRGLGAYDF